ncbi:MAG: type II toxin-antitoxin system HicA family toxin [Methylocella sp.]
MGSSLYRKLRSLLTEAGCTFVRQGKGSHEVWHSPTTKINFAVPSNVALVHTANEILKSAGLPKAF